MTRDPQIQLREAIPDPAPTAAEDGTAGRTESRMESRLEGPTVAQTSEAELLAGFLPLLRGEDPGAEVGAGLGAGLGAEVGGETGAVAAAGGGYTLLGPGDDCAVVAAPDARFVISTDTQVQGQDFLLEWPSGAVTRGSDTGAKAAAQNLADAAAMGAVPSALVVSLTLPGTTPVAWVHDFARGLREGIRACGADRAQVVGGDLGSGAELSVSVTVTGDLQGREPVLRSGARDGDRAVLAGTVGRAAAGLALLSSPAYRPGADPRLDVLAAAQLRPVAPVPLGAALARAGATAMIDVSDGLQRDAGRVAAASGCLIDLDLGALEALAEPLRPAAELLGADPLEWVVAGGEDHGLLAFLPQGAQLPPGARGIGSVRLPRDPTPGRVAENGGADAPPASSGAVLIGGRAVEELLGEGRERGWDHFERAHRSELGGGPTMAGPGRP